MEGGRRPNSGAFATGADVIWKVCRVKCDGIRFSVVTIAGSPE
jgi:hypothetical protein